MIERISSDITLPQFQDTFLCQNKPCIFSSIVTDGWRSRHEWVKNGQPNIEFLLEMFGDCSVQAADCCKKKFNSHEKSEMLFSQYLEYWKAFSDDNQRLLYLKDWHFQRDFPDYRAYEVPKYFQSDWLNEWYDQNQECTDDYRFVYMGPKGTWTGFHADVLRSYSWSANICGKKRWLLYAPGEEDNLRDTLGNLPFDVTATEMGDTKKYPNFYRASKPMELIQTEGEIVFIPSGWYHQVHNLEDTISINHNWTNAYGIDFVFRHLQEELALVEKEIGEFRDAEGWHQQCQLLLKCTAGMDYEQFLMMLIDLMRPRFKVLKEYSAAQNSQHGHASPSGNKSHGASVTPSPTLHAFKRFDITCIPKEHLEFGKEDSLPGIQGNTVLDEKLNEVQFHLFKLVNVYRRLRLSCGSKLKFENPDEYEDLVMEIENFLQTTNSD